MPSTHFSASRPEAAARSLIESSRFRASSGTKTLSSKWPCIPPAVIAASFPITCAATCVTTSGMTGFTFPGMIELPFCSSGRKISASPARGPEPISRRSFAIFVSDTATVFNAPEVSTSASRAACDSNGSAGAEMVRPVSSDNRRRTRAANSRCVFRPVPTAVPPSGIWPSRSSVEPTRS